MNDLSVGVESGVKATHCKLDSFRFSITRSTHQEEYSWRFALFLCDGIGPFFQTLKQTSFNHRLRRATTSLVEKFTDASCAMAGPIEESFGIL
jgi:hypothetical protein